jgi:uncharacterized repeat protein (TIGR03806 family)
VQAELFSDYAVKHRYLALPDDAAIMVDATGDWQFPDGAIVVKTFTYPVDRRDPGLGERLVETRLLVREAGAWAGYVYLWNDEQTDADRIVAGAVVPVTWIHDDGTPRAVDYRVPNANQCAQCHGEEEAMHLIGLRARQLHPDLLTDLRAQGLLVAAQPIEVAPVVDPFGAAPLPARARAYLDVNCAHCHSPTGPAAESGLYLELEREEPIDYGVCRRPVAAGPGAGGRPYDIVPGQPDQSILVFRMESTLPNIRMPELGRQLVHDEGIALVAEWIVEMQGACP